MHVLVVGGSGLVGTLSLPLLTSRHRVRVFDLHPPRAGVDVEYLQGDLRDLSAIEKAVRDVEAVVFMAMGPKNDVGLPTSVRAQFDVSVTGLHSVLRSAHRAGVRHAVYTSSMSVYRVKNQLRNMVVPYPDESVPPNANDPYGLSKRLGEEVCRAAVEEYGMSIVALRLCFPIPDEEWPPSPSRPRQAAIATSGRDTARAIASALDHQGHGFEAIAISGDARERIVRLGKARELLGWEPLDPTP
ncbi:MAG TPA: NAD(P)-dependent oxidoreductase [Actinopolymorphaceae bacterium]